MEDQDPRVPLNSIFASQFKTYNPEEMESFLS